MKYKSDADLKKRDKEFQAGDLVMVFLRKSRFPISTYHKLKNKRIGPCKIVKKINSDSYIVDLLADLHVSQSFNVSELTDYKLMDEFQLTMTLKTSSFLEGEN